MNWFAPVAWQEVIGRAGYSLLPVSVIHPDSAIALLQLSPQLLDTRLRPCATSSHLSPPKGAATNTESVVMFPPEVPPIAIRSGLGIARALEMLLYKQ